MATTDFVVKNGLVVTEEAQILSTTDATSATDTAAAVYTAGGIAIAKKAFIGGTMAVTGDVTLTGDLAVNGGDITTNQAIFNLVNATATAVNFAGAATDVQIGASTGTTEINNNLNVVGDIDIDGGDLTASTTSFNLVNATAETVNFAGAATAVNIGAATGTLTVGNPTLTMTQGVAVNINGANPVIASTNTGTASLFNSNITAINFGQAAAISMGSTTLNTTVRGNLVVDGNTTLGDASADVVTINANTASVPNSLTFTIDDAIANNVSYPIAIRHTTSGTAANNIGVGLQFVTETAAGVNRAGANLDAIATSATNGAENFSFVVDTMTNGGTAAQALLVNNNTVTVGASSTASTINTQLSSALTVTAGASGVTSNGNAVTVQGGAGGLTSGAGGAVSVFGGDASTSGTGGVATFRAGNATGANIIGADTVIESGQGTGTGRSGQIIFKTGAGGSTGSSRNPLSTVLTFTSTGLDIPGDITIGGNLTVNGLTTTINSNTVTVDDRNIELGSVESKTGLQATLATGTNLVNLTTGNTSGLTSGMTLTKTSGAGAFGLSVIITSINSATQFAVSINHATAGAIIFSSGGATNVTADGGGITLKGTTDKTFNWINSTDAWTASSKVSAPTFVSTTASGTAPLTVTSNTLVTNLNADLLDGQEGTHYLDWTNVTNKPDPVVTVTLTGDVTGTGNATLTDLASGTISFATTIAANSVALGTDTTGNYMINVSAGDGISVTHVQSEGSTATIAHADTSSQASVDNSGGTVIQDVTLDTFGHVTGLASVDLDLRYLGISSKAADSQLLDGYDSTQYQGPASPVKTFYWSTLGASATQARRFEIARVAIDFNDWNSVGVIEVELYENYYSNGLKKKYSVSYGYSSSNLRLTEYQGVGNNSFRVTIGAEVTVTGDHRYIPIFVEARNYGSCDVRVTTNRAISGTNPPPIGAMFINASPSAVNIVDFTPDSVPDLTTSASATINGVAIVTGVTASTPIVSSGGATPDISHANSGVAAGTYNSVTVNATGHVTAGSNVTVAETDTLATVTARGATTATACTFSSAGNRHSGHIYYIPHDSAGNHYPHFEDGVNNSGTKINWRLFTGATNSVTHTWTTSLATFQTPVTINGALSATSKSFLIDHPTKPGMQLRYGSLEGPENGVYVRGKLVDVDVIELPDYWTGLVHADSITVNLTAAGAGQQLYVERIENNCVHIVNESGKPINCFYTVYGERKDIDKLVVEVV
jgi:hypothetical protein